MSALAQNADIWDRRRETCQRPEAINSRASSVRLLIDLAEIYPIAFLTRSSVNGAWRKRLPVRAITPFDTAGVISGDCRSE
jgi:hypothetical protein